MGDGLSSRSVVTLEIILVHKIPRMWEGEGTDGSKKRRPPGVIIPTQHPPLLTPVRCVGILMTQTV